MNKSVALRIPFGLGERLRTIVFQPGSHEYVAFGLVTHATLGANDVLLLREIIELREGEYLRAGHSAAWRGISIVPMLNRAVDEQLGIILFHAHPGNGPTGFSDDDAQTAARYLALFRQRIPARPHGSVILTNTHASALIAMPREKTPRTDLRLRWYGTSTQDWPGPPPSRTRSDTYARQEIVVGATGQNVLRESLIAIVGLGGGGNLIVQHLAHLGLGHLLLIDDDIAEGTNRHRVVGMTTRDVRLKRAKVTIARRLARHIDPSIKITVFRERMPSPASIAALTTADIIIGCVDNLDAKVELQALAHRYLIPYIDIGLGIRATKHQDSRAPRVSIGGNVITYIPGDFCLWCCGHLSEEALLDDRGGPRGYVKNRAADAQVISLNGILASQAVNEALQLLTGYAGASVHPDDRITDPERGTHRGFKKLDGTKGTLEEWGGRQRPSCAACKNDFARGSPIWNYDGGVISPPRPKRFSIRHLG
jgi:hypothetical protein